MRRSFARKIVIASLSLALCVTAQIAVFETAVQAGIITAAQLNDYSAQVSIKTGGMAYSRTTKLYTGKLSIRNNGAAIDGTLVVSLDNLTSGVTLTNADGSISNAPYILMSGGLGAGAPVTIPLSFSNPANVKITFFPYFQVSGQPVNISYFETDADSQFEYDVNIKERLAFDTTFDFGDEPVAPRRCRY